MINAKLRLKVFPVVLLTVVQVVGMGEVARSQSARDSTAPVPQSKAQIEDDRSNTFAQLVNQLRSRNPSIRQSTAKTLIETAPNFRNLGWQSIVNLTDLFRHRNPEVRQLALEVYGAIEGEEAKAKQIAFAQRVLQDEQVLQAEAHTLAKDGASAIPAITPLLRQGSVRDRRRALIALGLLGLSAKSTTLDVVQLLKHPLDQVRDEAVVTLGKIGGSPAFALTFLTPLLRENNREVRFWASQAIGKIEPPNIEVIKKLLIDPDEKLRMGGAYSIYAMLESEQIDAATPLFPLLVPLLKVSTNQSPAHDAMYAAIRVFAEAREEAQSAIPELIAAIKSKTLSEESLRFGQEGESMALRLIGSPAIPALIPLLDDPNPIVQAYAAQAIVGGTSAISAVPPLIRAVQRYRDPSRSFKPTQDAAKHRAMMIALMAISRVKYEREAALSRIGEDAIPSLLPLLEDANGEVRLSAVNILGAMGKSAKSAIPKLIPLLKDEDSEVRSSAAEALKKLGYQP
jgi:HEAT repeat protein